MVYWNREPALIGPDWSGLHCVLLTTVDGNRRDSVEWLPNPADDCQCGRVSAMAALDQMIDTLPGLGNGHLLALEGAQSAHQANQRSLPSNLIVNERSKLTRFRRLKLTHLSGGKASGRDASI